MEQMLTKKPKYKIIVAVLIFVTLIAVCCVIFAVRYAYTSAQQAVNLPPVAVIKIEDAVIVTMPEEFKSKNSIQIAAQDGTPVYALKSGTVSLKEADHLGTIVSFAESDVRMMIGKPFECNITDGEEVNAGDIIGWFPDSKMFALRDRQLSFLVFNRDESPSEFIEM